MIKGYINTLDLMESVPSIVSPGRTKPPPLTECGRQTLERVALRFQPSIAGMLA